MSRQKNSNSSKIKRPPPILTKFRPEHYLILVHLQTQFEIDNSKFAQVRQFRDNFQRIQNRKKLERFNRSDFKYVYLEIGVGKPSKNWIMHS